MPWERIPTPNELQVKKVESFRLRLPRGWLVVTAIGGPGTYHGGVGQVYIDDPNHEWKIEPAAANDKAA